MYNRLRICKYARITELLYELLLFVFATLFHLKSLDRLVDRLIELENIIFIVGINIGKVGPEDISYSESEFKIILLKIIAAVPFHL